MSTESPASSRRRPPRLVPRTRSLNATLAVAPHRKRPAQSGAFPSLSRSDVTRSGGIFIELDEVAKRHRIGHVLRLRERIQPQCFLESYNQNRNTQRVESRFEQDQVIGQRG